MYGLIFSLLLCAGPSMADESRSVSATALASRELQVVGGLGLPLGTVCRVEGAWVDGSSLGEKRHQGVLLARVERVGGRATEQPVLLPVEALPGQEPPEVEAGERFAFTVYETGGFVGIPPEAFQHVPAVSAPGHVFETRLVLLAAAAASPPPLPGPEQP